MKIIFKKFRFDKAILIIVLISVGLFFIVSQSFAQDVTLGSQVVSAVSGGVGQAVAIVLGFIAMIITTVVGLIITLLVKILINIAQFNNIIDVDAVAKGWVIVRDLCNMFFILILLVIAFATILRVESYQWKKLLPKLLIMAVLINFSKTICGLIIDFAQVIMLTFVNGFAQNGPGNFISMFQVDKLLSIDVSQIKEGKGALTTWSTAVAIIAGVIASLITLIVIVVLIAILVVRIIMLWIYTILSPIAFLAAAFPAGQKYSQQWWGDFTKYVITGPLLAFFIWLALTTAENSTKALSSFLQGSVSTGGAIGSSNIVCAGVNALFCEGNFQRFIITIGFLIGGLMVTQQMGGLAGSIAGKGMQWASKAGKAGMLPLVGAKTLAGYGIDKLQEKTGVDLNLARVWQVMQERRKDIREKRYGTGTTKAAEAMRERGRLYGALAMTGTPGTAWEQITSWKGIKQRFRGGPKVKGELKRIDDQRTMHNANLEKLKSEQKVAMEIIEAPTSEQKTEKTEENKQIEAELRKIDTDLKALPSKGARTKLSSLENEEIKKKEAELTKQKEDKIKAHKDNETLIGKDSYEVEKIVEAKITREETEKKINDEKEEIGKLDDRALEYKPIMDYEAEAMKGMLEEKERKKIMHISDREELSSMARDAQRRHDKNRFSAISEKLAQDGNENDGVFNNFGYDSTGEGLQKFARDIAKKGHKNYAGFSEQEAKALLMKVSYIAEKNGHWGIARSIVLKDGLYKNATPEQQAKAVASEVAKMEPQTIARTLNRLGYGGERPDGKFMLNHIGQAILKAVGPKLAEQMNRMNPNAVAKLSVDENIKIMKDIGVSPKFISALENFSKGAEKVVSALDVVDDLKSRGIVPDKYDV